MRQLCKLSGYSRGKLKGIIDYWLFREPIDSEFPSYGSYKYIFYDGTYFHKDGCLITVMDSSSGKIISNVYADKEGYKSTHEWFLSLKQKGLEIMMDGEKSVIRAIRQVWCDVKIQRCLYHIQREGMRWLRSYPKSVAGKELRSILRTLSAIKSIDEKETFICAFEKWLDKHNDFIASLPRNEIASKDLRKTITLISNALPDMFYYLRDANVHSTTNTLEGFFSRLKADYRRHRGLTKQHRMSYLKWYCCLKNSRK